MSNKRKQLDYGALRDAIDAAQRGNHRQKKVKTQWGALKKSLKTAWQPGYIGYPRGLDTIKATTKEGRATIRELAAQFRRGKLVTKGTLTRDYGRTNGLIKKDGLEPDLYVKNPHYSSAAPMQWYSLFRVQRVAAERDIAAD